MPIWLRKFTFSEIDKFYKEEKSENEKISNEGKSTMISSDGTVNTPEFLKASQQYKKQSSYK